MGERRRREEHQRRKKARQGTGTQLKLNLLKQSRGRARLGQKETSKDGKVNILYLGFRF